jgi:HPt (histidine-containing phosphotransfer) domain-containing protein
MELRRSENRRTETLPVIERLVMEINSAINDEGIQASDAQADSRGVIDIQLMKRFLEDLGGDESLIREMVTLFLEESPKQLIAAHQALLDENSKELARIAHTLKGSSSYYGARRLAKPCTELEENCERGDLTGADSLIAQMEKEFAAVREALKSVVLK